MSGISRNMMYIVINTYYTVCSTVIKCDEPSTAAQLGFFKGYTQVLSNPTHRTEMVKGKQNELIMYIYH